MNTPPSLLIVGFNILMPFFVLVQTLMDLHARTNSSF